VLSAFLVFVEGTGWATAFISILSQTFFPGTAKSSIQISFNNFIKLTDGQTELLKNYITFKI
jgi:hypothetical protein